ncbi:MAG: hypothetical protein AMXMBFR13_36710 [Phycisphaerae bacterium]
MAATKRKPLTDEQKAKMRDRHRANYYRDLEASRARCRENTRRWRERQRQKALEAASGETQAAD